MPLIVFSLLLASVIFKGINQYISGSVQFKSASYVTDRTQFLRVSGLCPSHLLLIGVPQRSILGPILLGSILDNTLFFNYCLFLSSLYHLLMLGLTYSCVYKLL